MCIKRKTRKLLPIESAANVSARTQAGHVPGRHAPIAVNEEPRLLRRNQTATVSSHSTTATWLSQSRNRCATEPWTEDGIKRENSPATTEMPPGTANARMRDSNQHRRRPEVIRGVRASAGLATMVALHLSSQVQCLPTKHEPANAERAVEAGSCPSRESRPARRRLLRVPTDPLPLRPTPKDSRRAWIHHSLLRSRGRIRIGRRLPTRYEWNWVE
jgi:hypothetical protein